VLIHIIDMMLHVTLLAVKLILPTEHLGMILGMLFLPLIDGVQPQVATGEVVIKILIKVGLIELERTCDV